MADGAPTVTLTGVFSCSADLVDQRQVARIGDDDDERVALAARRHEAVAQHQLGGDRPEQLAVDMELRHVDVVQPVALGQPPRLRDFGGALRRVRHHRPCRRRVCRSTCGSSIGSVGLLHVHRSPRVRQLTGRRQLEHRHVERQQDQRDHHRHDHQHQRLDQLGEAAQRRLDALVVEVGDARSAFPAARRSARRRRPSSGRRRGTAAARPSPCRATTPSRTCWVIVSTAAPTWRLPTARARHLERRHQRDAAAEQRRQRARELRRRELRRHRAEAGQPQDQPRAGARRWRAIAATTSRNAPPPTPAMSRTTGCSRIAFDSPISTRVASGSSALKVP